LAAIKLHLSTRINILHLQPTQNAPSSWTPSPPTKHLQPCQGEVRVACFL